MSLDKICLKSEFLSMSVLLIFQLIKVGPFQNPNGYIAVYCFFTYISTYLLSMANLVTQNVYTIYDMTYYEKEKSAYLGLSNVSNAVLAIACVATGLVDLAYWQDYIVFVLVPVLLVSVDVFWYSHEPVKVLI